MEATNWTIWFPANWDTGIVITCCVATPSKVKIIIEKLQNCKSNSKYKIVGNKNNYDDGFL